MSFSHAVVWLDHSEAHVLHFNDEAAEERLHEQIRREVARIVRIWGQTLVPPAITMTLYFLIFGKLIGSKIGDQSEWFFPESRFFELWQSQRQIFAIVSEERLTRFPAPAPRILVKGYQHLLVTNQ